jgi:hypothetical protein
VENKTKLKLKERADLADKLEKELKTLRQKMEISERENQVLKEQVDTKSRRLETIHKQS